MNNRLLSALALVGIILIGFGVLFLLAAFSSAKYILLALVFLGGGGASFVYAIVTKSNAPRQTKAQADAEWLPIDDWGDYAWYNAMRFGIPVAVLLLLYKVAGGPDLVQYGAVGMLAALAVWAVVSRKQVAQAVNEQMTVMDVNTEFRSAIRSAFDTRRRLLKVCAGIPASRRDWWTERVGQTDEVVGMVLNAAKRASDVQGLSAEAEKSLLQAMQTAKTGLDKLAGSIAVGVAGLDQLSFERELTKVQRDLTLLSGYRDGLKEVDDLTK